MNVQRQRLRNRRLNRTESLFYGPPGQEREFSLGVGFDPAGHAREIFMSGAKVGSGQEAVMQDGCVLVSMLLQSGWTAARIAGVLAREDAERHVRHASVLGAATKRAAEMEHELAEEIRRGYRATVRRPGPYPEPQEEP